MRCLAIVSFESRKTGTCVFGGFQSNASRNSRIGNLAMIVCVHYKRRFYGWHQRPLFAATADLEVEGVSQCGMLEAMCFRPGLLGKSTEVPCDQEI